MLGSIRFASDMSGCGYGGQSGPVPRPRAWKWGVMNINERVTSGPTPQVASSAVHMSTQANKEKKNQKRKKRIERDSNSGRHVHRQCV